ncbi:hypothetical protein KC571_02800, partial [candidate division WWE3 bacterium]|nr:hypothetical protein [candidate division WWE3 bacterium]
IEIGLSPIMKTTASIFYWYGFYKPEYQKSGVGMRAMLEATSWAKHEQLDYAYLGTAYTSSSLYKTNIPGFEFFNGFEWSADLDELKYLISKDQSDKKDDLLLDQEYREQFYQSPNLNKFLNRYA